MSRYNMILAALLGLTALPLLLACNDDPLSAGNAQEPADQEHPVQLIPEWSFIAVGETARLRMVIPGRGNDAEIEGADKLEWESSDPTVAIVDGGEVRGLEPGSAVITAEFEGYRGSARVTVRDRQRLEPEEDGEIE